jgi:hypothetical protein
VKLLSRTIFIVIAEKIQTQSDQTFTATTFTIGQSVTLPIAEYAIHVYMFTTDSTGGSYKIALTNLGSDCDWILCSYSASATTLGDLDSLVLDGTSGTTSNYADPEIGNVTLAADTSYFLEIIEYSSCDSKYTLSITKP